MDTWKKFHNTLEILFLIITFFPLISKCHIRQPLPIGIGKKTDTTTKLNNSKINGLNVV